ncbi:hypothetical protein [Nonomuraea dietziae]|uniref:hypothetical protein n=1 Tax=Nonomuraea dietziae TaxID=65515 RepID=UPI0033E4CA19
MALSRRALTPLSAGVGGALLGLGAITRTVGVALLVLAVVFALLRRTRWRTLAGLALAVRTATLSEASADLEGLAELAARKGGSRVVEQARSLAQVVASGGSGG